MYLGQSSNEENVKAGGGDEDDITGILSLCVSSAGLASTLRGIKNCDGFEDWSLLVEYVSPDWRS